jgi:hypothetical protein
MKQIFEILEEERDRILNIYESAKKSHYLNVDREKNKLFDQEFISESKYNISLKKKAGWNSGALKGEYGLSKFKVQKSDKQSLQALITFDNNYSIDVQINCKTPDTMIIGGDGQFKGSEYKIESSKLINTVKWHCAGKPNKQQTTGGGGANTETSKNKYVLKSKRILYTNDKKIKLDLPAGSSINFYPEKNGATGQAQLNKDGKVQRKNFWFNCNSGKFLVKDTGQTYEDGKVQNMTKTFSFSSDKPFTDFLQKRCQNLKGTTTSDDQTQTPEPVKSTSGGEKTNTPQYVSPKQTITPPSDTALDIILQKIPTEGNPITQI